MRWPRDIRPLLTVMPLNGGLNKRCRATETGPALSPTGLQSGCNRLNCQRLNIRILARSSTPIHACSSSAISVFPPGREIRRCRRTRFDIQLVSVSTKYWMEIAVFPCECVSHQTQDTRFARYAHRLIINPASKQLTSSAVFNAFKNKSRRLSVFYFQRLRDRWPQRACGHILALLTRKIIYFCAGLIISVDTASLNPSRHRADHSLSRRGFTTSRGQAIHHAFRHPRPMHASERIGPGLSPGRLRRQLTERMVKALSAHASQRTCNSGTARA